MSLLPNVAQLQREHVNFELECLDRMYLNAYVPRLTTENGIAWYFRGHLGHRFASTKEASPMTERFIARIGRFQSDEGLELVRFQKGQRKDDVFKDRLKNFKQTHGVVFIGVAQEKARV